MVVAAAGGRQELVLRRYLDVAWLAREPDLAVREAEALMLAARSIAPTPRLVAVDEAGTSAGVPAVLMDRLPGAPLAPVHQRRGLASLAAVLPQLHATPVPASAQVRRYRPYYTGATAALDPAAARLVPPPWAADVRMWERAIERHRSWTHPGGGVFLHRDFHPGNVLFEDGRLTGVVDWANASLGAPDLDVGHCRANFAALVDLAAADEFRDRWLAESGAPAYDPAADVLAVVGLLPAWREGFWDGGAPGAEARLEALVGRAVADLA